MKHTFKYILLGIALMASSFMAQAQNDGVAYNNAGGVSTNKTVVANGNGGYTITLETFATGTTSQVYSSTPVDVVLVLDYSRSMTASYNGTTRLQALKNAVGTFVDEIARNDTEDDDGVARETPLGNRIAVVTFESAAHNLLENETGAEDGGFLPVSTSSNVTTIKTKVNDQGYNSNTYTNYGMSTGSTLIQNSYNNSERSNCNRVLVLFTDGNPGVNGSFSTTIANQCIKTAQSLKNDYQTTIYVVGLVTNASTQIIRMMNSISSNYPNASSMTDYGTGGNAEAGYYQDATQVDLEDIFESIAQASGGSSKEIGTATQIRDQASSSFVLPKGFDPDDDVTVEVWDIDEDGDGWTKNTSYDVSTISKDITVNSDGDSTLVISGFDYSKADTKDENGYTTRANAGNWVGQRYLDKTTTFWAGKKVVVKFDIYAKDGATGGDGTGTNAAGSGVYVYDAETDTYTCVNQYTLPVADLPINIKIKKSGLRHGESATFEIHRFKPLTDDDGNIVYNAINKPKPDTSTEENWTKVIITNKGADGAEVTKTLLSLDPSYIYSVIEDDWGWAYDLTGTVDGVVVETGSQNTSIVAVNPFTFVNKEKTDVVKHAEAVTINHFATSADGEASVETYKSSKVKTF